MNCKIFTTALDITKVGIQLTTGGEKIRQLVHFELHLRDLEVDLLKAFESFFGRLIKLTADLRPLEIVEDLLDSLPCDHTGSFLPIFLYLLLQVNVEKA